MTTAELIRNLDELRETINKLDNARKVASTIDELSNSALRIQSTILKELEYRDVIQRGNYGWENRSISFLMDIVRHCDTGTKTNE